ncbi:MAG: hypothetical protein HYX60_11990, partial [Legionella longbeachae]|nr:hypothetical protein [Legionella longbeachae]
DPDKLQELYNHPFPTENGKCELLKKDLNTITLYKSFENKIIHNNFIRLDIEGCLAEGYTPRWNDHRDKKNESKNLLEYKYKYTRNIDIDEQSQSYLVTSFTKEEFNYYEEHKKNPTKIDELSKLKIIFQCTKPDERYSFLIENMAYYHHLIEKPSDLSSFKKIIPSSQQRENFIYKFTCLINSSERIIEFLKLCENSQQQSNFLKYLENEKNMEFEKITSDPIKILKFIKLFKTEEQRYELIKQYIHQFNLTPQLLSLLKLISKDLRKEFSNLSLIKIKDSIQLFDFIMLFPKNMRYELLLSHLKSNPNLMTDFDDLELLERALLDKNCYELHTQYAHFINSPQILIKYFDVINDKNQKKNLLHHIQDENKIDIDQYLTDFKTLLRFIKLFAKEDRFDILCDRLKNKHYLIEGVLQAQIISKVMPQEKSQEVMNIFEELNSVKNSNFPF